MFSMFTSERWANLIKAQLITTNGQGIDNWGFPCLFFDSKFNKLLSKKYMQINSITGNHFHVFSFANPPEKLINNRLTMLNQRYRSNEIDKELYLSLKQELDEIKLRRECSESDIDFERESIREQIVYAYRDELDYSSQIDIIVFDINAINDESSFIDAYVINTTFEENDYEEMLSLITKISVYSKEIYLDNKDRKFERILKKLKTEELKMKGVKIAGDMLKFYQNIKSVI